MRKLLLADDSITIQKVVQLTFIDEGFAVTTVGDGEDAIEKLAEEMPDIVLADVFMPGKTGYEVCERIKSDARFQHIPVMLLVGSFEPYNEAEARRVGANDVLTKPFQSIRQLVSKVGSLLGGNSADNDSFAEEQREAQSPTATTQTSSQHVSHVADSANNAADIPAREGQDAPSMFVADKDDNVEDSAAASFSRADDAPKISFADPSLDDQMIEATPAENFTTRHDATRDTTPLSPVDARELNKAFPTSASPVSEHISVSETFNAPETDDSGDETLLSMTPVTTHTHTAQEDENARHEDDHSAASPAASVSHNATAHASDDSLLDLGDLMSPSAAAVEADDFILDLRDELNAAPDITAAEHTNATETPYEFSTTDEAAGEAFESVPHTAAVSNEDEAATLIDFEEEMIEAAPETNAYVEARNIGEDERADFPVMEESFTAHAETNEPLSSSFITAPEQIVDSYVDEETQNENVIATAPDALVASGEVALPQWDSPNTHTNAEEFSETESFSETSAQAEPLASPSVENAAQQLSPEVIDQIARRVVEHLSDNVVREIAWEVVPELAELIIKRRLEEENSQTP